MGVCAHAVNVCASLQYWYNPTTKQSVWEDPSKASSSPGGGKSTRRKSLSVTDRRKSWIAVADAPTVRPTISVAERELAELGTGSRFRRFGVDDE